MRAAAWEGGYGVGRKRFITYQSIENRAAYLCEGRAKAAGPADPAKGSS